MVPIKNLPRELKQAYRVLNEKALSLLLMGGGIGLIIANNFASYSRFSGARNKIDKYFYSSCDFIYRILLLGEGRKHWIFKFSKLTLLICQEYLS
jgi:hypothetical protein